jgi:FKBP-type peptidyl-prolyl cis-trans isomerase
LWNKQAAADLTLTGIRGNPDPVKTAVAALSVLAIAALSGCASSVNLSDGLYAQFDTSKGIIICSLSFQKAPMTVSSFVGLAEGTIAANGVKGKRYFDGLTFHRVVPGFVIQGGDPKGDGTGGPGYEFPNEIVRDLKHDGPGVMAMANAGPDTNGSQFYITLAAAPQLDGGYSVFGRVVQGQSVVNSIAQGDKIKSVKILRVGAAAKAFTVTQASFEALVAKSKADAGLKKTEARKMDLETIARKWPGLTTTKSGLMYQVLKNGAGSSPTNGTMVTVHYTGTFLDGTVFDSSVDRGAPTQFKIGGVIQGWNEALLSMKKGEKRLLVIPPELGYGERGYPGAIPGNAFLVFEVELLGF